MIPPSRSAISSIVEEADPLVRIGDIVKHPKYGVGLVIEAGHIPGFMSRGNLHDPRVVETVTVLWDDGQIDKGWPATRLAKFVCTSRGLNT